MTTIKRITGTTLACLATVNLSFAQVATPSETPDDGPGLLGKRYVAVSLRTVDFRDSSASNGVGGSVSTNLPINQHLDADAGYSYFRRSDGGFTGKWHDLNTSITAYKMINGFKPFADAGIGYSWFHLSGPYSLDDENAFYGAGAGVELPLSKAASVTLRTGFSEIIESGAELFWSHSIQGVYWFTPRVAATGAVSFNESVSVTYSAGVRLVF